MTGQFDQIVGHLYQGRILSFKIIRQKPQDAVFINVSVKTLETSYKAFFVDMCVFYVVTAIDRLRSAAAFKKQFRLKFAAYDFVRFEKRYR